MISLKEKLWQSLHQRVVKKNTQYYLEGWEGGKEQIQASINLGQSYDLKFEKQAI